MTVNNSLPSSDVCWESTFAITAAIKNKNNNNNRREKRVSEVQVRCLDSRREWIFTN